jgi:hypothetical protein
MESGCGKTEQVSEPVQSLFAGFNATLWASASPPDLLQAMLGEQQRRQACGAMERIPSLALIAASHGSSTKKTLNRFSMSMPRGCCATQGRTRARG